MCFGLYIGWHANGHHTNIISCSLESPVQVLPLDTYAFEEIPQMKIEILDVHSATVVCSKPVFISEILWF
jgi:hypothetical protein